MTHSKREKPEAKVVNLLVYRAEKMLAETRRAQRVAAVTYPSSAAAAAVGGIGNVIDSLLTAVIPVVGTLCELTPDQWAQLDSASQDDPLLRAAIENGENT